VVRAGEGAHVEGAALDANLLERRPGCEIYAIRFHPGAARHAQPHPFGVEEHLHIHEGRVRVGPEDAPVELGPGDYARFSGAVPHLYEALGGEAAGTLVILI
jgi:quercetin dioxygenase-like cupin family protein